MTSCFAPIFRCFRCVLFCNDTSQTDVAATPVIEITPPEPRHIAQSPRVSLAPEGNKEEVWDIVTESD